ncbi:DoxX family membrane protein [Mangrovimonas sp. CR14]|uniref:BT_3928 family protein n=1 Tax=Mangrovimonas sp. CR14 TaxID=2706120 RepID=UPI0014210EEE|nr:BT_3928 family protein [Mangrovimonas sp. CR14]NIK92240.1 DoxX family membrane protein [Mangrovimonas sp. CR14]
MKILVTVFRILVGVLFIISGLIKLNDPLGFSYKLQEYFSEQVLNLPALEPYALLISVFVVVFEVVLGVFLLIGYKPKFTVWSLLGMIVFFTFLTFYSAYFNKVKDCGCFGDALKLTPWESFWKDVALLVMILFLFIGLKYIKPIFSTFVVTVVALVGFLGSLWFGYHVLMHLPSKDFRPYKVGANINENMIVPEGAPKAVNDYHWKFKVNGEEKIITTRGEYPTVNGEFIGVDTEEVTPGYEPPIHDFSIERDGEDYTEDMLNEDKLVMIVTYNLNNAEADGLSKLSSLEKEAKANGYKVIGMTASGPETQDRVKKDYSLDFDFYFCDETALKTIVRASPGILVLNNGTITQKVHWNDLEDLKL